MEDYSWKSIIFGAGASILLLLVTYFFITTKSADFLRSGSPEYVIEFTRPHVIGRQGVQKDWEIIAQSGGTTKNQETTKLTGITQGWIYEDNIPTVKNLRADQAIIFKRRDEVEAKGTPLTCLIDLHRAATQDRDQPIKYATLAAAQIKYSGKNKTTEIFDGVRIKDGKLNIFADYMLVNHTDKTAKISKNVWAQKGELTLFCSEMQAHPEDEEYEAFGNLRMQLDNKEDVTKIFADRANFKQKGQDVVEIFGNIQIIHPRKIITCQSAVYNNLSKTLVLHGNIQTIFEKADSFLSAKTKLNLNNKDAREILNQKIILTSREMTIFTDSDDALSSGEVLVTQNSQAAQADQATYIDKDEKLYLQGAVTLKKQNRWLAASKVTVDIQKEIFEAVGSVQTKFLLKK